MNGDLAASPVVLTDIPAPISRASSLSQDFVFFQPILQKRKTEAQKNNSLPRQRDIQLQSCVVNHHQPSSLLPHLLGWD